MNNLKIFLLSFVLLFAVAAVAISQEVVEEATEAVNLDENVQPEDLEIEEPTLLPDSPFYFLKNWGRAIQAAFTFNSVKKAELRMKFANEKLMEAKKIVEKTKDPEVIQKATENYQQEIEKIKNQVEKIREKAKDNPRVESFLDKFIHQQTLHQKLLQRLETQVPPEAFEKIKEARERHLERFQDVMLKLEDRKEKITEKLDKILEEQKGSQFKNFKNLEVLKNLEEKVPEEAKEAIQKAQENALKRLQENLEKMSPEDQERFKEYLEKISGEKERHLEILENLKSEIRTTPETPKIRELKEKLEEGRIKMLEKIEQKLERLDCPLWVRPAPGFCPEGRIIVERDPETGCPLLPKCVVPGEIEIPKPVPPEVGIPKWDCIALWDPVCGKDGKTYSNECFAKAAGVEIDYQGVCKEQLISKCPSPIVLPPDTLCQQVMTYAKNPDTGECCEYGNPCVAPEGWQKFYTIEECQEKVWEETCDQKCKSLGFKLGGICRSWTGDPSFACRLREVALKEGASDCPLSPILAKGQMCCCFKESPILP